MTNPNEDPEAQTKTVEEPVEKRVFLEMPHCGQIAITKDEIRGWFHPITLEYWSEIIGFHKYMANEIRSETVSYHRWNPKRGTYDTIIPHQTTAGLSVNVNWESKENVELIDKYGEETGLDFFPACTIHTHVDVAAFESGTDANDEEASPGWHITLGELITGKKIDLHCRFRLPIIPKVKELTSVEDCYTLHDSLLFERDVDMKLITGMDDSNTKLQEYEDRVTQTYVRAAGKYNGSKIYTGQDLTGWQGYD